MSRSGFCIYIDTVCDGPVPVQHDEEGHPVVHATEVEAQRDIAEDVIERCQQFLAGERAFDDAMTVEEYVEAVDVGNEGAISDMHGNRFPVDKHQDLTTRP